MRFTFLGTAAANAYPEAFCQCHHCERARALGGASLRKRSSALVNDDLLIDFGPDIQTASMQHGISLTNVRYCLQTHAHADHLDTSHFLSRSPEFGVVGAPRLHWYASQATAQRAAQLIARDCAPAGFLAPETGERLNLEIHRIEPLHPFAVGPYQVIGFPANHDPTVDPLLYAIEAEGRRIFYGIDTAVLPEATWRGFHDFNLRFDLVVLDHTFGFEESGGDHLNAVQFVEQMARLRDEGLLNKDARVFATHISHPRNPVHPELADRARGYGYEIAYDGLVITLGL